MLDPEIKAMIDSVESVATQKPQPVSFLAEPFSSTQKINRLMQEHLDIVTATTEKAAHAIVERVICVDATITTLASQLQHAMQECEAVKCEGLKSIADLQSSLDDMGAFVKKRQNDAIEHEKNVKDVLAETKKLSSLTADMMRMSIQGTCLAVNAASQAAQAGEQGRGFKVVANEVRNMSGCFKSMSVAIDASIERVVDNVTSKGAAMLDQTVIDADVMRLASFTEQLEGIIQLFQRYNDMNSSAFDKISHSASEAGESIMEMMASVQFQDITRQQIETVKSTLDHVNQHFDNILQTLDQPDGLQNLERLNAEDLHVNYVMNEQRDTHQQLCGAEDDHKPEERNIAIELF